MVNSAHKPEKYIATFYTAIRYQSGVKYNI